MSIWYLPEILRIIFEFADKSDFATLCLASRTIYDVGNQMLYETIELDLRKKGSRPFDVLCETLLVRRPELALFARRLHIRFGRHNNRDKVDEASFQLHTLSSVITKCTNLQSIYVMHEHALSICSIFDFTKSIVFPRKLRELGVEVRDTRQHFHYMGEFDVNTLLLSHALGSPSITNLTLTLEEGPDSSLRYTRFPINDSIIKLTLTDSYFDMKYLDQILAALPRLEELSLSFLFDADPTQDHVGCHLECEELGHALTNVHSTLRSLKIAAEFQAHTGFDVTSGSGWPHSWGPSRSWFGSLRHFKKLKSLEIAPEVLLGWVRDVNRWDNLSNLLPESLESLCFGGDFLGWDYALWSYECAPLCDLVEDYLAHSNIGMLRELAFTCYDDPVDEEELRESLSSVELKCNELNIRLQVKTCLFCIGPFEHPSVH